MAESASDAEPKSSSKEGSAPPPRAVERAISLIRKAEVKSVPRTKIKDFLKRKNLTEDQIATAYEKFFDIENLVEHCFEARPLGFSVVMDPQGKNAVVSSIQNEALETEFGLERLSRIVKVNDRWVEHKKHQDIIDYILDRECPITFSFRKRVHKRRGSLFKKVQRPSRSQPAQKSRGSMVVNNSGPKLTKSRGSTSNVLGPDKKASNLFNPNSMDKWSNDAMDSEAKEMKAMLAALTMQNSDLTHDKMADDEHLVNLSSRTKNVLHAKSTGTMDNMTEAEKQELGEFGKDMFDLWGSMDGLEAGGGEMDEEGAVNAYVIEQAQKMRMGTSRSAIDLDDAETPASPGGLNVPAGGRMRAASSPVYSTDALVELHKGSALMKYGRRGSPKFRMFQLSKDNKLLIWFSEKKDASQTRIPIDDMVRIEKNQQHDSRADPELRATSFTIVYNEDNESTLKLTAKNATEAYLWTEGLKKLIEKKNNNEPLQSIKHLILDKQPGLDLHRRQSLANLMEKRTGAAGSAMRDKSVKKIRRELKNIRKNYEKAITSTKSKKFEEAFSSPEIIGVDGGVIKTLDQHNKELERAAIDEVLESIVNRLTSLDQQVDGLNGMHEEMFDGSLQQIKADAWNCSVDLVALQSKIKVLMANPVIL